MNRGRRDTFQYIRVNHEPDPTLTLKLWYGTPVVILIALLV